MIHQKLILALAGILSSLPSYYTSQMGRDILRVGGMSEGVVDELLKAIIDPDTMYTNRYVPNHPASAEKYTFLDKLKCYEETVFRFLIHESVFGNGSQVDGDEYEPRTV